MRAQANWQRLSFLFSQVVINLIFIINVSWPSGRGWQMQQVLIWMCMYTDIYMCVCVCMETMYSDAYDSRPRLSSVLLTACTEIAVHLWDPVAQRLQGTAASQQLKQCKRPLNNNYALYRGERKCLSRFVHATVKVNFSLLRTAFVMPYNFC